MTNDEAIRILDPETSHNALVEMMGGTWNQPRAMELLQEAQSMGLQALREKQTGGWIPVRDRLPEETDIYLVNIHQKNEESGETGDFVITAWYQKNSLLFTPKEIGWTLLNEWYDLTPMMREYISHWQPLPEPPKEN